MVKFSEPDYSEDNGTYYLIEAYLDSEGGAVSGKHSCRDC